MSSESDRTAYWLHHPLLGLLCGIGLGILPTLIGDIRQHYPVDLRSLLMPASALLTGAAAAAVPRIRGHSIRQLLIASAACLATGLVGLMVVYSWLIVSRPVEGAGFRFTVVKSWEREADCCIDENDEECLAGLAFMLGAIENCWGEGRVVISRLMVSLAFLITSSGLGAVAGCLLALRHRSEPTPVPPVVDSRHTIFVSYRRADVGRIVDGIRGHLVHHFGERAIKMDVYDIAWGEDFEDRIEHFIEDCDVVLVVIGERWLEELERRLDSDAKDYVLVEIAAALRQSKKIMPLVVDAGMPGRDGLPAEIKGLSAFNAMAIHSAGQFFGRDMNWVVWSLMEELGYASRTRE